MSDSVVVSNAPGVIIPGITIPSSQGGAVADLESSANVPVNLHVQQELEKSEDPHQPLLTLLTQEEHQAVIDKMRGIVQQPAGHLPRQEELYLEQQLSDMLGFEIAAELEGYRLNHSIGIMEAQPHLRRFPTDTLVQHDVYQEAGIRQQRGAFGWFTEMGQLSPQGIAREKYYFAVQAAFLPQWHTNNAELKNWLKFRKMIVVNPFEQKAVVGVVGDVGPSNWMRRQFGGSPEVIREAGIWSLATLGRVLVMFINDPSDKVPLGPVNLQYFSEV